MFLIPGLVIGSYVSEMTFTLEERLELIRYIINRAHPDDGGWGMCVFTVLYRGENTDPCHDPATLKGLQQCLGQASIMSLCVFWVSTKTILCLFEHARRFIN